VFRGQEERGSGRAARPSEGPRASPGCALRTGKAWQFTAALLLTILVSGGAAHLNASPLDKQAWIEIRSPHFLVFTDASAAQGRSVATHFEQIRAVFRAALPGTRIDPPEPVRILAMRNGKDFQQLLPKFWATPGETHPTGLFVDRDNRDYIVLRLDASGRHDLVFYHEYVHLLESLNFPDLPLWLSEGLADFYGSVRFFGEKVGIGYPILANVYLLDQGKDSWMPFGELLAAKQSSKAYKLAKMSAVFYAESWALTDFLFTSDNGARRPALFHYLALVSKGTASLEAAREAFGNLDRLEAELLAFVEAGRFPYSTVPAPFPRKDTDLSSQPLSAAETDAVLGDFTEVRGAPEEARVWLARAIRLDPNLAAPYETLARLAMNENDRAAALRYFDRATALDSKNYQAWYFAAMLSLHYHKGPSVSRKAEIDLEQCLRLNPDFAEGYRALADLKSLLHQDPEQALQLARRAVALRPTTAANYLTLGVVLLRMKRPGEAAVAGQQALKLAKSTGERSNILRFLRAVHETEEVIASAQPVVFFGPLPTLAGEPLAGPGGRVSRAEELPGTASGKAKATTREAVGVARKVECKGVELTFVLGPPGAEWHLHTDNYTLIEYESAGPAPTDFSPCRELAGRRVLARYVPAKGQPRSGELTRIDLQ
jgi:tetratricopeptide (TPR) repeat protein